MLPVITTVLFSVSQACSALTWILTVSQISTRQKGNGGDCMAAEGGGGGGGTVAVSVFWRETRRHPQALSPSLHFSLWLSCSWAEEVTGVAALLTVIPAHHHPCPLAPTPERQTIARPRLARCSRSPDCGHSSSRSSPFSLWRPLPFTAVLPAELLWVTMTELRKA